MESALDEIEAINNRDGQMIGRCRPDQQVLRRISPG
jgi:hypothetical protein